MYKLIAELEDYNYIVVDIDAESLDEAQEEARFIVMGDKSNWTALLEKAPSWRERDIIVSLDPNLESYDSYGECVLLGNESIFVKKAWLTKCCSTIDIDKYKKEVEDWKQDQKEKLTQDPEYLEYLRLKKKFE